jgi:membrane fusion protein, multidrug efflux system
MTAPLRASTPVQDQSAPPAPPHEPHPAGDLGFELPPPAHVTPARAFAFVGLVLTVLAAAFFLRWLPARHARQGLEADSKTQETALPRVQVVAPVVVSSERAISLPGSVQPLEETVVYPRASGYIRNWSVDLGDKVKEGDLLAEIDTPDLDQQIAQARAQLAQADAGLLQARANAEFSKANYDRYKELQPAGLASQQDLEKAKAQAGVDQATIGVAQATINAQHANLQYLGQLKTFARVVAPFAGTVTLRTVERGTLVSSGTATPLFRITAMDPVRVFVQVPQDVAAGIHIDVPGNVTIREFPGRVFAGHVAHSEGALDAATRTMMTEVRVPNPKGEILTGMYAQVALTLPAPHRVLSVPATALLSDAAGLRVALVDAGNHIRLVRVVVERDTGTTIELSSGLQPEDRVVKLPSADLTDGRAVEVAH